MNLKQILFFILVLFTGQTTFAANNPLEGKKTYRTHYQIGANKFNMVFASGIEPYYTFQIDPEKELVLITQDGTLYIASEKGQDDSIPLDPNTEYKIITQEQIPNFVGKSQQVQDNLAALFDQAPIILRPVPEPCPFEDAKRRKENDPLKGMKIYEPTCEYYTENKLHKDDLIVITENGNLYIATKEEIPNKFNAIVLDEKTLHEIATQKEQLEILFLGTHPENFSKGRLKRIFNDLKKRPAKNKAAQKNKAAEKAENKVVRFAKNYKEALIFTAGTTALIAKTNKEFKASIKDKKLSSLEYAQAYAAFIAHKIKTDKICGTIFGAMTAAELYCLYLRLK